MVSVGMVHMGCYCGTDLFIVGNDPKGRPPAEVIELLRAKLGPGNYGYFSSDDGAFGECPGCGLVYELPDPEVMDWLPFLDKGRFADAVEEMRETATGLGEFTLSSAALRLG